LVQEEIQYLRVAMGHENESFEDFVKAHDACQEDLMYFPTNNSYGLASVAGNADKISALQNDFEIVKKRMDEEAKKASRLEQKIKLLTQRVPGTGWETVVAGPRHIQTDGYCCNRT